MFKRIAAWWKRRRDARREALMYERRVVVAFDAHGVSVTFPNDAPRTMAWAEVQCVAIETNDSGPWSGDVWWLLESADRRIGYPLGATGDDAMLTELMARFPALDHGAVVRAMGCADNARFVCWERTAPDAADEPGPASSPVQ